MSVMCSMNWEGREMKMSWAWTVVDVSEEVVGCGNGSSCSNPGRRDYKTGVHRLHLERSEGLAVGLPSELSWVVGTARERLGYWF